MLPFLPLAVIQGSWGQSLDIPGPETGKIGDIVELLDFDLFRV